MTDRTKARRSGRGAASPRPVILSLMGHYLPGWRAGGHIAASAAAIDQLGHEFDFKILCLDRDLAATAPYPGVRPGVWATIGKAQVCYLPAWRLNRWWREAAVRSLDYDLLWVHGLLKTSTVTTLLRRRFFRLRRTPLVIIPHGELSDAALGLKRVKKRTYLALARLAGLYDDLWWQPATRQEVGEIVRAFPGVAPARMRVARNLAANAPRSYDIPREKRPGALSLVFLSRISRMKNLDLALRVLAAVEGEIVFDLFGPIEDRAYWSECQSIIESLPSNVRVTYRGAVQPEDVIRTLSGYHALVLPSRSESFGHAILEALQAGCLLVISDTTPWRGLERARVGWDISLSDAGRFRAAIERLVAMGEIEFQRWSAAAAGLGRAAANDQEPAANLRSLFHDALQR